jgi:transcriptional regulator with XRE-family HTH domain
MKTWIDRARELMSQQNLTYEDIAEKINASASSIGHYLNRRRAAPLEKIEKIAIALGVTPAYLQYGTTEEAREELKKKLSEINAAGLAEHRIPLFAWQDFERLKTTPATTLIIDQILTVVREKGDMYSIFLKEEEVSNRMGALKVIDLDAMQPTYPHKLALYNGDILIIDFNKKPISTNLALVQIKDMVTVRQYVTEADKSILKPLNSQYPICTDDFYIVGTIIKIVREFT